MGIAAGLRFHSRRALCRDSPGAARPGCVRRGAGRAFCAAVGLISGPLAILEDLSFDRRQSLVQNDTKNDARPSGAALWRFHACVGGVFVRASGRARARGGSWRPRGRGLAWGRAFPQSGMVQSKDPAHADCAARTHGVQFQSPCIPLSRVGRLRGARHPNLKCGSHVLHICAGWRIHNSRHQCRGVVVVGAAPYSGAH